MCLIIKLKKKLGSIGIPIKEGKMKIIKVKNSKSDVEIYYEGPNVCMGYASNFHDLKKKDIWRGALFTGDIGKKDRDGYFYIVGRKKDSVKFLEKV